MITMETVAAVSGVSVSTVSHVINKTRKVNPETERAVLDAIAKVGYAPNRLARALAGASTMTIGVAISALSNHYFASVVHAIEAECSRQGRMMMLADTHEDPAHELRVVQALHERRVDGILIAPCAPAPNPALAYLREKNVPTVQVDRFVDSTFDQIAVEGRESMRKLVAHLIELGHRRIALVSGEPELSTTNERVDGYRLALADARIAFDPAFVVGGKSRIESAFDAVRVLLQRDPRPSALVSGNNLMTIGAMRALRLAGMSVPVDMSLVGFDDFDWADEFSPRLTVLAQPVEELGSRAIRLLMRRIANPDARRQSVRLAPTLRIRESASAIPNR